VGGGGGGGGGGGRGLAARGGRHVEFARATLSARREMAGAAPIADGAPAVCHATVHLAFLLARSR
jgi:hypothetical protein